MTRSRVTLLGALALSLLGHRNAHAWDTSTTHQQLTERAVLESRVHVRWMQQSALQRGLFTALRIDPDLLPPALRRQLVLATDRASAASGAVPLGGPGACPPPGSPPSTREYCVDGDRWETDALGWIRLGLVVETIPATRLLHHFADLEDPAAERWTAVGVTRRQARRISRALGESVAARVNRTAFAGSARSALAWLADPDDPWTPRATAEHLRLASLAPTANERAHHLALALIGLGALLHVTQDLSVPAHARGDLLAFGQPLSDGWSDRGLALQEYVRTHLDAGTIQAPITLAPREPNRSGAEGTELYEAPVAASVRAVLLGSGASDETWPGLVPMAAQRFVSAGTLPRTPVAIPPTTSATAAAERVLAQIPGLAPDEREGAVMHPWPADAGYLRTSAGRALAAFERDSDGHIQLYLDSRIYRETAAQLLPRAVVASASIIDLLLPEFPDWTWDETGGLVRIELPDDVDDPRVTLLREDGERRRTPLRRITLTAGARNRIERVRPPEDPQHRLVMVFEATRDDLPIVVEQVLQAEATQPQLRSSQDPSGSAMRTKPTDEPETSP